MNSKILITAAFFIFILASGFWLSRLGRPINTIVLTIHKLISVAAVVYLVINAYHTNQATSLTTPEIVASAVAILLFLVMIATGGLLSVEKEMPSFVHKIHQFTPYLVILSTSATLYLLLV
jgi:heme A synthase